MRIPRYWSKGNYSNFDDRGKQLNFTAWGWSFDNIQEAEQEANRRASRIFQRFTAHTLERYPYLDTPMREEIVEDVRESIILTRNRYGAVVLNTNTVMFADIDFPENKGGGGMLKKLFKSSSAPDPITATIDRVKEWSAANPRAAFRLYRTYAGLRLLFVDKLYQPSASETDALLVSLGADPLYRKLTQKQESFRARLTPKPWRCNCSNPPNQFPWETAEQQQAYREWEEYYAAKILNYSTCHLLEVVGKEAFEEEIQLVVRLHDQYACTGRPALA